MGLKSTKILSENIFKDSFEIPLEDRQLLKTLGLEIHEMIGFGEFGSVHRGVCGLGSGGLKDFEGNPLDVELGQEFAVKYVNVKGLEDFELSKGNGLLFQKIRRFVEKEKQFRNKLVDQTLVRLRICVNLGDFRPILLNKCSVIPIDSIETAIRPSYDRIYLITDFAKFGNLGQYLEHLVSSGQNVSEDEAILWMHRLLSAVKYLQDRKVKRINLKTNNVLMFEEVVQRDMFPEKVIVPKLCDFLSHDFFDNDWDDNELEEEDIGFGVEESKLEMFKNRDNEDEKEEDNYHQEISHAPEVQMKVSEVANEIHNQKEKDPKDVVDYEEERQTSSKRDEEFDNSSEDLTAEDESSDTSSEESMDSIEDEELSQRTDIFQLALIFETIVAKTQFNGKYVRNSVKKIIKSMKDFSAEDCGQLLSNELFESFV